MSWVGGDPWAPPDPDRSIGGFLPPRVSAEPVPGRVQAWLRTVISTSAVIVLFGAPIGVLWIKLSSGIAVVERDGQPVLARAETKEALRVDGDFALLTAIAGIACGLVVWQIYRRRGTAAPAGLAVGSLLAAVVARTVGARIVVHQGIWNVCQTEAPAERSAFCTYFDGRLHLRVGGFVFAWAVAGLLTYFTLTALRDAQRDPTW